MNATGPDPRRGPGPAFFLRRPALFVGIVFLLFVAGGVAAALLVQVKVTFPTPPLAMTNPEARLGAGAEQIWLETDGSRVEAWLLPARRTSAGPLLIYAHGNGELIDLHAQRFEPLRDAGIGVLLVEYPGYGRSSGTPSETSLTAALVAAYDRVSRDPRVDSQRIIGHGRSLGGGAIAQLAARRPLAALILESTFESLGDVVMSYGVPRWLVLNTFDTRAVLQRYGGAVLVLHGTRDGIFPSEMGRKLAEAARRGRVHLSTCGHNDCGPQWELVLSFLAENGVCKVPVMEATDHETQTNAVC